MAQRIKGQEVRVTFVGPNGTETALSDVQSFELEMQLEVLSEGYLGETTERKDDIFRGVHGRMEIHIEAQEYLRFMDSVVQRSQRRTAADAQFNVIATLNFPNGTSPRVLLEDVFFASMPTNVGARDEYVQGTIEFECSGYRTLF